MSLCFLCEEEARLDCPRCEGVRWVETDMEERIVITVLICFSFCSEAHQRLHLGEDGACLPYQVVTTTQAGKSVIATRDIQPGELIFREEAVAFGPNHDTAPLCLSCLSPVTGEFVCPDCGLPLCDERCARGEHGRWECRIFRERRNLVNIEDFSGSYHPFYQSITPLRCLMLKRDDPVKWNSLKRMMDHNEEREKDDHWKVCQHNIVNFLINVCHLPFTAEEINHVIGLIEVNAFEVRLGCRERDQIGRGVFPLLAKLNHGCVSNARYVNVEEGTVMECRATVVIREGEEVRDHYVSPLEDTVRRREALSVGWYFSCECWRCADREEAGTNLSSFSCSGLSSRQDSWGCSTSKESCPGLVTAVNILQSSTDYRCEQCDTVFSSQLVTALRDEITDMLAMTDQSDVLGLEFLLEMYGSVLHQTNSIILTIKRFLIYIYGRSSQFCSEERLAKKVEWCEEILSVCDLVMPGLTRERGLTLYELAMAQVQSQLGQSAQIKQQLEEAERCLQFERPGTFEHLIQNKVKQMKQYLEL